LFAELMSMERCPWCEGFDLYREYHDSEWGVPLYDDRSLFELLSLEGAQAGLSWATILKKRENTIVVMLMTPPRHASGRDGRGDQHRGHRDRWRSDRSPVLPAAGVGGFGDRPRGAGRLDLRLWLPGWAIVRWVFNFIEKNRDAGIDEVAKEVKEVL
jgi:hypothetical protein